LAIIKDLGAPIGMFPFSRVCVFVSRRTVKICQSMGIPGEVGRYPVQDNADFISVHIVDKIAEVLRSTITGSRRIIACYLIAPGAVKGMLCNPHKFYVSISHLFYIVCKGMGQFPVIVKAFVFLVFPGMFFPGTGMYLVNGHSVFFYIKLLTFLHPCSVCPFVIGNIHYPGGCTWTYF